MTGQGPDAEQVVMLQFLKGLLSGQRHERAKRYRPNSPARSFSCERLEHRNLLSASGIGSLSEDTGDINGYLWNDLNGDGTRSNSDPGLAGWSVFLDANRNGLREEGEPTAITNISGAYTFYAVPEGDHVVSAELLDGWELSTTHDAVRGLVQSASVASNERPVTTSPTLNTIARDHVADQLIIRFTDAAQNDPEIIETLRNKQKSLGHVTIESTKGGLELWDVGVDLMAAYRAWEQDPHLAVIELNYNFSIAETVPDDDRYPQMWALDNTGQTGGTVDADIDAPEAWDLQTGSSEIVIGVIDSGIDYTHPDLANNIWTNPGEIAGNGIDDDGNGYVDDIHGWDFASGDSDPMDGNGHGTHVAGTIAAAGNNSVGITGVNWNAKLMPLRFLNDAGSGSIYHAVAALEYATMMGADITNNSWIGDPYTSSLQFAINQANAVGSLYVVCAGNNHNNNDLNPEYPASYAGDNVISVAATTKSDELASYSNYGASTVHLGAPGSNILSTKTGGGYTTKSGTSMASPHVAGVASLLLSKRTDLTPVAIRQAILQGTDTIQGLEGKTISDGRLNAYGALMEVAPSNGQFVSVASGVVADVAFGIMSSDSAPHQVVEVLDNGDEGFTHQGFTYQNNFHVSGAYGGDNHSIRGESGFANWTFSDLANGEYQVSATWLHKYNNAYNAIDAPYTIFDGAGQQLAQSIVNQTNTPSELIYNNTGWDKLATVDVTDGTLVVSLGPGANPNQYAVADAIMIEGSITPALTLSPTTATTSEDSDGIQITVNRTAVTGDLTVTCASSDESEATVPNTVVIPDGSTTATFTVTPTDDDQIDGTQSVTITVGAAGYASTSVTLQVTDNESSWAAILDNGDQGFSQDGYTYYNNPSVSSAYQEDTHTARGGTATATWTFSNLEDGDYQVAATWFRKYNNAYNATDAPFVIQGGTGQVLDSVAIDQSQTPDDFSDDGASWKTLSTVTVTDGELAITLGLGSNSNRYSVADAIRIERIGDPANPSSTADRVFGDYEL